MAHDRITATIKEHRINLPLDVDWPDDTEVTIERVSEKPRTWGEIMSKYAGMVDDMPSDLALNHDHYLHGAPKK